MIIELALSKEAIIVPRNGGYIHILDDQKKQRILTQDGIGESLETDGFLYFLWDDVDSIIDIGDVDYFYPDKCKIIRDWIRKRLEKPIPEELSEVYSVLLEFFSEAVELDTLVAIDL